MFQGLRQGNLLYVLDKSNLTLRIGEVESVSNPTPKYNQGQFTTQPFSQSEMQVDVRAKFGDESLKFEKLPANSSITSNNNVIVSDNKDAMNMEVEAMLRNSRGILDSVPYHEKVIATCDLMLRELNPQFAKEKEQEEKIDALEEKMGGIENTLNQMMGILSEAIGNNKSRKNKEE